MCGGESLTRRTRRGGTSLRGSAGGPASEALPTSAVVAFVSLVLTRLLTLLLSSPFLSRTLGEAATLQFLFQDTVLFLQTPPPFFF